MTTEAEKIKEELDRSSLGYWIGGLMAVTFVEIWWLILK